MGPERQGKYSAAEVARRARGFYERGIREKVEPEHAGRYLAVDAESGDYEIADDALAATRALRERKPDAAAYLMRVGRPAAYRLGGRAVAARS